MPWIIDYPLVLEQMREQRFKSLYYNSGAFGFAQDVEQKIIGWLGPPDSTLKAQVADLTAKLEAANAQIADLQAQLDASQAELKKLQDALNTIQQS